MSNRQETYLFGQGRVEIAERIGATLGEWVWLGDVSDMSLSFEEEKFTHKESYSGQRSDVRELSVGTSLNTSLTIHELSAENVARFTRGTVTAIAEGTVTDESLGTVAAGDIVQLENLGVSDLVISDSTAVPVTIDPEHYSVDPFGEVVFTTLPTPLPTMPLLASYKHTSAQQATFLSGSKKEYALRFKGVNLAELDKPVLVELYKVSPSLLQTLSLITSGNQLASAPVEFKPLLDTSKSVSDGLGQYGRMVTVGY